MISGERKIEGAERKEETGRIMLLWRSRGQTMKSKELCLQTYSSFTAESINLLHRIHPHGSKCRITTKRLWQVSLLNTLSSREELFGLSMKTN